MECAMITFLTDGDDEDLSPVPDDRFVRMLLGFQLIGEFDIQDALALLRTHRANLNAANAFIEKSQYETSKDKALEISLVMERFYENLPNRCTLVCIHYYCAYVWPF